MKLMITSSLGVDGELVTGTGTSPGMKLTWLARRENMNLTVVVMPQIGMSDHTVFLWAETIKDALPQGPSLHLREVSLVRPAPVVRGGNWPFFFNWTVTRLSAWHAQVTIGMPADESKRLRLYDPEVVIFGSALTPTWGVYRAGFRCGHIIVEHEEDQFPWKPLRTLSGIANIPTHTPQRLER